MNIYYQSDIIKSLHSLFLPLLPKSYILLCTVFFFEFSIAWRNIMIEHGVQQA